MAHRSKLRGARAYGFAAWLQPHISLAGLTLLAAAPILLTAALLPRETVLPALSLAAIAIAAVTAAAAWWRKSERHTATVTLWDAAGAFMLIGCAAAMMTEPENLLQVFGHTPKP